MWRRRPEPRCTRSPSSCPSSGRRSARATRCGARWRRRRRARGLPRLGHERLLAALRLGLLGPLLREPDVEFVKGFFRRPYRRADGAELPADGGRVTELAARPLLSAFYPELAGLCSRSPARWPRAARCSTASRSPRATPSRPRCSSTRATRSGHRADGPGGPRRAAQPPPAASRARPDGLRGAAGRLERLRAEGRLLDDHAPPLQTADGGLVQVEVVKRPPYATLRARA